MRNLNRFDLLIIITIASLAWGSFELLGALTPIRLLGAFGILYVVPQGKYIWPRFKYWLIIIAIWFLYNIFSFLWVPDIKESFISFFHISTMFGVFLLMFYSSIKCKRLLLSITLGWVLFLCITLPIAFWEITTLKHLSSGSFNDVGRGKVFAAVTFMNYNSYVVMLIYAFTFICSAFLQKIKGKFWVLILLICTMIVLLINASRGGILCSAILLMFMLAFVFRFSESKSVRVVLISCLAAVVFFVLAHLDEIGVFENIIRRLGGGGSFFKDSTRVTVWMRGFRTVMDNYLIGRGPGSMVHTMHYKTQSMVHYAHNYYLEMLMENGAIIALTYFTLFYKSLMQLVGSKDIAYKYIGIAVLLMSVVLFVIDDYYSMRSGVWVFFACIAVLSSQQKIEADENTICTSE